MGTGTAKAVQKVAQRKTRSKKAKPAPSRAEQPTSVRKAENSAEMLALQVQLDSVRREYGKLQQAIYEAAQVQRKLCAPRELTWGEFEIAGESFGVRHLTGDFFKVMELDSALGIALGDIAGKGLSAGIWHAHLMDLIQRCARANVHPADCLANVNAELCGNDGQPPLTALFFARLDPQRNELTYCNAGLPAPLVLRQDKTIDRLETGGPMLGALNNAVYSSGTVKLHPGDMLLAYSDGLTECRNPHDQEFESHRLSNFANALPGGSANQVLFATLGAVLDFADTCPPADDLTLLVVRRAGVALSDVLSTDFSGARRGNAIARPRQLLN